MSYMYTLASLYTQYFVKCPTQDSQVDWPMANGTIRLKIKIHSFIHSVLHRHFVRITETTSPEAQLSTCSDIAYGDKMKTATVKVRWYNAKHREGMCMPRGEVF